MRIKYLCNKDDPRISEFTQFITENFPTLIIEQNPDIYLVAGGDGSMLHAMQENISSNIPYLGKALGTVNFLMNNFANDKELIEGLLMDTISIEKFESFAIEAILDGVKIGEAINEVIIGSNLTDYYHFNITTGDGNLANFELQGSGICISTPIGSTAFNFNNSGRILPLDSCLLSITGIVCNRYLNDIIPFQEIKITSTGPGIFLSNIKTAKLSRGSELILRKGTPVELAFLNKKEFLGRRIALSHRYRK